MPRPKGSKNKKSIKTVAQMDAQIAVQAEKKAALEAEMDGIGAVIEKQKQLLRAKKKELHAVEKAIVSLTEKKAAAEAAEVAAAKKVEIEQVVAELVGSGKSADEILQMLKK